MLSGCCNLENKITRLIAEISVHFAILIDPVGTDTPNDG